MRAPKAQSYGAQALVRAPKVRSYGTHPSLHNRVGTFASQYNRGNVTWVVIFSSKAFETKTGLQSFMEA